MSNTVSIRSTGETVNRVIYYSKNDISDNRLNQWRDEGFEPVCFVDSISRLKVAIAEHPSSKIFIADVEDPYSAYLTMINEGISEECILSYSSPKYCEQIGRFFVIHGPGVQTCCEARKVRLPHAENTKENIEQYKSYCSSLSKALQLGLFTTCNGCLQLQEGSSDLELEITTVNISSGLLGGDNCNLKCFYCTYGELDTYDYKESILEIIDRLSQESQLSEMIYAAGEITVSPYRDQILDIWLDKKWSGQIHTNAVQYSDKLASILSLCDVSLYCSLDSGTSETFERIKGADCFEKATNNLRKYAAAKGGGVFF